MGEKEQTVSRLCEWQGTGESTCTSYYKSSKLSESLSLLKAGTGSVRPG